MELTLTDANVPEADRPFYSIPLNIDYDGQGDASFSFAAPWPEDSTFDIDHIRIRYFFYDSWNLANYDGTRIVQFTGQSTNPGTVRVVMTRAEFNRVEAVTDPIIAHFRDYLGSERRIEIASVDEVTTLTPRPDGWVYVDLQGPVPAPVQAQGWITSRNSPVLITAGTTLITTVEANTTATTDNVLSQLTVSGTPYNIPTFTLPLFARKTDLFLGTMGTPVERDFVTTGSVRLERVAVTPYTTAGVTYYFIPSIGRPPLPTTNVSEWVVGDGVWTTLDFTDNTVNILDVTEENMVNLIG